MNVRSEFAGLGSQQIDHQQNYPGGRAGAALVVSALPDKNVHFCRGCGRELAFGSRNYFHRECMKADKRRRFERGERGSGMTW